MRKTERPARPSPIIIENNNVPQRAGGITIGLGGILTIIFVLAQIFELISWSWWWVFAPLWLPWALIIGIPLAGLLIFVVLYAIWWLITTPIGWAARTIRRRRRLRK